MHSTIQAYFPLSSKNGSSGRSTFHHTTCSYESIGVEPSRYSSSLPAAVERAVVGDSRQPPAGTDAILRSVISFDGMLAAETQALMLQESVYTHCALKSTCAMGSTPFSAPRSVPDGVRSCTINIGFVKKSRSSFPVATHEVADVNLRASEVRAMLLPLLLQAQCN